MTPQADTFLVGWCALCTTPHLAGRRGLRAVLCAPYAVVQLMGRAWRAVRRPYEVVPGAMPPVWPLATSSSARSVGELAGVRAVFREYDAPAVCTVLSTRRRGSSKELAYVRRSRVADAPATLQFVGAVAVAAATTAEAAVGRGQHLVIGELMNVVVHDIGGAFVRGLDDVVVDVVEGEELRRMFCAHDLCTCCEDLPKIRVRIPRDVLFPYTFAPIGSTPSALVKYETRGKAGTVTCCMRGCHARVRLKDRRCHVAKKLLLRYPGIVDGCADEDSMKLYPEDMCRFCGRLGVCSVYVKMNYAGSWVIVAGMSNQCQYFVKMSIRAARSHCSNVPVRCPLCPGYDHPRRKDCGTCLWS